jgi:hypothetical protein
MAGLQLLPAQGQSLEPVGAERVDAPGLALPF